MYLYKGSLPYARVMLDDVGRTTGWALNEPLETGDSAEVCLRKPGRFHGQLAVTCICTQYLLGYDRYIREGLAKRRCWPMFLLEEEKRIPGCLEDDGCVCIIPLSTGCPELHHERAAMLTYAPTKGTSPQHTNSSLKPEQGVRHDRMVETVDRLNKTASFRAFYTAHSAGQQLPSVALFLGIPIVRRRLLKSGTMVISD